MFIKLLSKARATRIMHNSQKGKVNYHILFKKGNYLIITTYDLNNDLDLRIIGSMESPLYV